KYYLGDAEFMLKPGILTPSVSLERVFSNRHDGSWTTEAYANVVKTLSIAIGPHITKNHIKNRMKTLKDHFAEAYDLFHHLSRFAWNPVTRKFESEEEVWQDFIKIHQVLLIVNQINYVGLRRQEEQSLHDVAQRQVESAERQASMAEKQVSVAEKQVSLIERQVAIAEKGLAIMQQSRHRLYSESDVWNMLTDLGLIGSTRMQCYQFLCENEQKKRQIFGIPPEMRLDALFHFMTAAGVHLGDMES
ncbi:hypothetical protein HN51_024498, partial [Arachis hypogaea]